MYLLDVCGYTGNPEISRHADRFPYLSISSILSLYFGGSHWKCLCALTFGLTNLVIHCNH